MNAKNSSVGLAKTRWLAMSSRKSAVCEKFVGRAPAGKNGGARVICCNLLDDGMVVLLTVYAKSVDDSLSDAFLRRLLALEEK